MLDLSSFKKALASLKTSLSIACSSDQMKNFSADVKDTIQAGVIQHFEFTYELCWKFIKRWLEKNLGSVYVDGINRRELFRLATEHGLIKDIESWMGYHDSRNETSHTYDRETADEVFESAKKFLQDAEFLLAQLEAKND